ncbi:MAG: STAS domain-containing protein [Chitinispirillia bacterium]
MDNSLNGRVQTFRFGENLSISTVDNLIPEIDQYLNSQTLEKIVLDMSNVLSCDSYGITFLLQCYRKAKNTKKELVLYKLNPFLHNLLNNCGLLKIFSNENEVNDQK